MHYELSDYEWIAIKPMLPNKARGVRRVSDRRVLNCSLGSPVRVRHGATWQRPILPADVLQSLRSLAAGWRMGPDHGCAGCWS
ncbi:transposase [Bradyrhizobium sp. GM2.4]